MFSCILMKIYENIEENKLIQLHQFYHKWYSFLSLIKIYLFSFRPSLNCLKLEFYLYSSIEMYFKVFDHLFVKSMVFLFFLIYMQYFMLKIMFLLLGFMDIIHFQFFCSEFSIPFHFLRPTTRGNLGLKKILWLRARITWLAHDSCFSFHILLTIFMGLPWWPSSKEPAYNAGDVGLIHGSGRSPKEGNGNLFQYSCLGNVMDRGALGATVHRFAKELDIT